jgi:SAM-dependent methyltransferase
MGALSRVKFAFATPFMRRLLNRPDPIAVRREAARKYLRGKGIEVGANRAPLPLPEGAAATYVDCEMEPGVDMVSDMETLPQFHDESLDFVIANHVLEHVENPIKALHSVARVLRQGGIAFIALPNKQYTFDKSRPVTDLSHIVRDFEEGPEWSRRNHLREWVEKVERLPHEQVDRRVAELDKRLYATHIHVWDPAAMGQMFGYMARNLMPIYVHQGRGEVLWILRKETSQSRHA